MTRHDPAKRAQRIEAGLCIQCGAPSPDAHRCDTCREANRVASAEWRARRQAAGQPRFIENRKDWRIRRLQLKRRQIERGIAKAQAKLAPVVEELHQLIVLRELEATRQRQTLAPVIPIQERPSTAVVHAMREDETDQLIADLVGRGYQRRSAALKAAVVLVLALLAAPLTAQTPVLIESQKSAEIAWVTTTGQLWLMWDEVPNVNGYVLYLGPSAGVYTQRIVVGTPNIYVAVPGVGEWHIAVTAYLESFSTGPQPKPAAPSPVGLVKGD